MKFTAHMIIERPLEKVFDWMFQPQHIVQLLTRDPTKEIISNEPIHPRPESDASGLSERIAKMRRFQEQAETVIEIEDLSTPTIGVGTTFQYRVGVSSRSEEFPAWRLLSTGSIAITKSVPPTSFTFTTRKYSSARGYSPSAEHHLGFQAQQERTIITHTQSTGSGKIGLMIASVVAPGLGAFGNASARSQLMHLKSQMEVEIE